MERERFPGVENPYDEGTISLALSTEGFSKGIEVSYSMEKIRELYACLAQDRGLSKQDAGNFFKDNVNFAVLPSDLIRPGFHKTRFGRNRALLGSTCEAKKGKILVAVHPEEMMSYSLTDEPFQNLDVPLERFKQTMDMTLVHELTHVLQIMQVQKKGWKKLRVGQRMMPYGLVAAGTVFGSTNRLAVDFSLVGAAVVGSAVNDYLRRKEVRKKENDALSNGQMADDLMDKIGIRPFNFRIFDPVEVDI